MNLVTSETQNSSYDPSRPVCEEVFLLDTSVFIMPTHARP